jgi:hypothetical protein
MPLVERVCCPEDDRDMATQQTSPILDTKNLPAVVECDTKVLSLPGSCKEQKRKATPPEIASLLETPSVKISRRRLFPSIEGTVTDSLNDSQLGLDLAPQVCSTSRVSSATVFPQTEAPKATSATVSVCPTATKSPDSAQTSIPLLTTINGMQISNQEVENVVWDRFYDVSKQLEPALIEYLVRKRVAFRPLGIHLLVLGCTEDVAKPWIVIYCPKKAERKVKRFLEKDLAKNICHGSQSCQIKFETAVCRPLKLMESETLDEVFVEVQESEESEVWCPRIKVEHFEIPHYATLGGFVCVIDHCGKQLFYGLTVGHVLPVNESYDGEDCMLINDDEDVREEGSDNDSDSDMTTDDDSDEDIESSSRGICERVSESASSPVLPDLPVFAKAMEDPDDCWWTSLGNMSKVSYSDRARNRDWALVKLTAIRNGQLKIPRAVTSALREATRPMVDQHAMVSNGVKMQCIIPARPSRAILPSGSKFVDVYILQTPGKEGL